MKLLAVESATATPSVAVCCDGAVRSEVLPATEPNPSGTLLPAIDAALAQAGVRLTELDGIAVAIGPGSFTGLRVGLASVKGLAFGGQPSVAAVSTLAALAAAGFEPGPRPVLALLDARRGEVYAAAYSAGSEQPDLLPEGLYRPEELAARLPDSGSGYRLVGDAADWAATALKAEHPDWELETRSEPTPLARPLARLGQRILERGQAQDAATLVPHYLRRAEAEARRTGSAVEPPPTPGSSS